ncbi:hypothetical protein AYI69_g3313, partial [Smittium culicis]
MGVKMMILWKGGPLLRTYCKKTDRWKYQCEDPKRKTKESAKR